MLQTLLDNETIMPEHQKTPRCVLDATVTTIKFEDHFWHFWDELLLDVCQRPNKSIHTLNTCIVTLVNQCKFPDQNTKEMPQNHGPAVHSMFTMRTGTGYIKRTSPSLPNRPYSCSANYQSPTVRCTRRLGKRAMESIHFPECHNLLSILHIPGCPPQPTQNAPV